MFKSLLVTLTLAAGMSPLSISAQNQPPDDGGLLCTVQGNDVQLEWFYVFLVPIQGYILARDGVEIAKLPPEATNYLDRSVPAGDHIYLLSAVNFDGNIGPLSRCQVTVPKPTVRCAVEGRTVHIEWDPLLIDIVVRAFIITRNGDLVGTVPGNQFTFDDPVPGLGSYLYEVAAVVSEDPSSSPFPVGSCTVAVDCFGMKAAVDGLKVFLEWEPSPLMGPFPVWFLVQRDGQFIARIQETTYVDTVPAPGEYLYEVWLEPEVGEMPTILHAACKVIVPGNVLPSPKDLECNVFYCRAIDCPRVIMKWTNPVTYDWIQVFLDGQLLATLKGSETYYEATYAPPGIHVYALVGTKGDQRSFPARCEVAVQPFPIPPQDLRCIVFRGDDSTNPDDCTVADCPPWVLLTWTNGDDYGSILILRDNLVLATLPGGPAGDAGTYEDRAPPAGEHVYCVVGIAANSAGTTAQSQTCCNVFVPGTFPPPPADLTCTFVVEPGPQPDPTVPPELVGFVLLEWRNPVAYEEIVILRNDMVIATIPGPETTFRDYRVTGGIYTYSVTGILNGVKSGPAQCTVEIPPVVVPPPQDLYCYVDGVILNPTDPDLGQNGDPTGSDVYPVLVAVLKWWNPIRYAGIVISRNKAIIARLPGDAMMYRDVDPPQGLQLYGVMGVLDDGRQSPIVTCEVYVGEPVPPVVNLICAVEETASANTVDLSWENGAPYTGIAISRNGQFIAELPGDATFFKDPSLDPGVYIYEVVGVTPEGQSRPAACQVVVGGGIPKNLLYFSSGFLVPSPDPTIPPVAVAGSRITCLADNDGEVQGWSFGVGSDPKFIVPVKYDLDETETAAFNGGAGPAFLSVKLLQEGVVMAAVIEDGSNPPVETLPPGSGHKLLNIEYAAGPSGAFGEVYSLQYSDALGDPPVQVLFVVNGFEARPATFPGWVTIPGVKFIRGDVDGNGLIEITDPIRLLKYLFLGGEKPGCMQAADANGSMDVNIADPVYILSSLYTGGPPPPAPFPECGEAPAPLGCEDPGSCK